MQGQFKLGKLKIYIFTMLLLAGILPLAHGQSASDQNIYQPTNYIISGTDFTRVTDCWAKIYQGSNFNGASLTLIGFTTWEDMSQTDWPGVSALGAPKINSVEVGPGARLILYKEPYFSDEEHNVSPGVSVRELPLPPNADGIRSIKLLCDPI